MLFCHSCVQHGRSPADLVSEKDKAEMLIVLHGRDGLSEVSDSVRASTVSLQPPLATAAADAVAADKGPSALSGFLQEARDPRAQSAVAARTPSGVDAARLQVTTFKVRSLSRHCELLVALTSS